MNRQTHTSANTNSIPPVAAPNQVESEQLLTTSDICDWLQVAEPTLRTWVRNGAFPKPMKLGQLSRWPRSTVEEYLSNKQAEASASAAHRAAENGDAA
jgi:excisionase family DNA binding protein